MRLTRREALGLRRGICRRRRGSGAARNPTGPTAPLRILVGTSPGGSPDIVSRLFADKFASAARPVDHG